MGKASLFDQCGMLLVAGWEEAADGVLPPNAGSAVDRL